MLLYVQYYRCARYIRAGFCKPHCRSAHKLTQKTFKCLVHSLTESCCCGGMPQQVNGRHLISCLATPQKVNWQGMLNAFPSSPCWAMAAVRLRKWREGSPPPCLGNRFLGASISDSRTALIDQTNPWKTWWSVAACERHDCMDQVHRPRTRPPSVMKGCSPSAYTHELFTSMNQSVSIPSYHPLFWGPKIIFPFCPVFIHWERNACL